MLDDYYEYGVNAAMEKIGVSLDWVLRRSAGGLASRANPHSEHYANKAFKKLMKSDKVLKGAKGREHWLDAMPNLSEKVRMANIGTKGHKDRTQGILRDSTDTVDALTNAAKMGKKDSEKFTRRFGQEPKKDMRTRINTNMLLGSLAAGGLGTVGAMEYLKGEKR